MIYFVRNNKWDLMDFLWSGLECPYEIIELPPLLDTSKSRLLCKVAHLLWKFNIYLKWQYFEKSIYEKVSTIKKSDHVIFVGYFARAALNLIPYLPDGVTAHISFWDKIANLSDYHALIRYVRGMNVDLATYDLQDARTYGLRFVPQYYNFNHFPILNNDNLKNDFYYMGSNVDIIRLEQLNNMISFFDREDWTYQLLLVDNKKTKWISYTDNLKNVSQCRCIIELNKPGQFGLTMRTMEALAMKKKLITNNPRIKDYPFYSRENIFIWGEDDVFTIKNFLEAPYENVEESVINDFDVNNWIKKILSNQ